MRLAFGATAAAEPALLASTRGRAAARRQVREPQPACWRPRPASSTGCSSSTTTCACRTASSTASSGSAPTSSSTSPSRPRRQRSHSAWRVTRRRPASLVRETRFVEIGPLTAFGRRAAAELLPFPDAALRLGARPALGRAGRASAAGASAWSTPPPCATRPRSWAAPTARADARAEAARFLADRPYLPAAQRGRRRSPPTGGRWLMRLLFLAADMQRGGAERHWATLLPALAARGHEVRAGLPQRRGAAVRVGARRGRGRHLPAPARARRRAPAAAGARARRGRTRAPWSLAA